MDYKIPWVELAIKEALKSTYKNGIGNMVRVGAVVFNKKQVISSGHNYGNRSLSRSHNRKFRKFLNSIHAEVDAIIRARTNLKGASIVVVRIDRSNNLRLSKPCEYCEAYIRHVGIRNVFYSTNSGKIVKRRVQCRE